MQKSQISETQQNTQQVEINEFQIIEIQKIPIIYVNSYSTSKSNEFLVICTQHGVIIVHNYTFKYNTYLRKQSPFYLQKFDQLPDQQLGVKIASLIQNRNEVAVVPNFTNNHYKQTHVYIFDYEMHCILYKVDFFLEIDQLTITQENIIVSNQKRIVIYNYLNDTAEKTQKYYLDLYGSNEPNTKIRYLETFCENYIDEFTISEIMDVSDSKKCLCGRFLTAFGTEDQMIITYIKTSTINNQIERSIYLFNSKYQKQQLFTSLNNEDPFDFAISQNGEFLAYTVNYGKNTNVYNIKENVMYCVLYAGRNSRQILKIRFFSAKIQGKDTVCLGMIRRTQNSTATMHIFRIQKKPPTTLIQSQYKRYFSLFQHIFVDYNISQQLIGPDFFIYNNVLYIYSLCGIIYEAIDFSRSGNREKKKLENIHLKWQEEDEEEF